MGTFQHHTIVVTAIETRIEKYHEYAEEIFDWVSAISPPLMNGYRSFFVPPDGGKESMECSHTGDDRREQFINLLKLDGMVDWVEVSYGELGAEIENSHWGDER